MATMAGMRTIHRPSHSETLTLRQLRYHVRHWGQPVPGQAPLVLLHGWMDVGASYQFVVDALRRERHILAPDWRGFGHSDSGQADSFWFPDYLGDLDFLLDHYAPDQAVDLVGHSMGGHVAMLYAGIRPTRVRRLVNLEGFGMPATQPHQAPGRYARWLDDLHRLHRGELDLKSYPDLAGVAQRLMKTNPRLQQTQADWLAPHWAEQRSDGRWHILGAPAHKLHGAQLFRVDEVLEVYRCIRAPVLCLDAADDSLAALWGDSYRRGEYQQRLQAVPNVRRTEVAGCGHMLHHDQPALLAGLIEDFLA